ncbi:hypothetical protein FAI40_01700 [Acetobacteraceae bacterium]|nr:hypothetical protein FAI40_01700 [Acetobacteraceae bacterium]
MFLENFMIAWMGKREKSSDYLLELKEKLLDFSSKEKQKWKETLNCDTHTLFLIKEMNYSVCSFSKDVSQDGLSLYCLGIRVLYGLLNQPLHEYLDRIEERAFFLKKLGK